MTMEYCLSDRYQADFTDHNGGHKADNGLAQKWHPYIMYYVTGFPYYTKHTFKMDFYSH